MQLLLTPDLLLGAYREGLFPMSYSATSPYVHWVCPEMRGQLSIQNIHIPRRLKKTIRSGPYAIKINTAFEDTVAGCAATTQTRPETWINNQIMEAFIKLHKRGHAHSVECWMGPKLVGGLYGLAIGGAFFGESMFSTARDASKIALIHLTARLWKGGFTLLDTQFTNEHLEQFGVYEIPYETYKKQLQAVLPHEADFLLKGQDETTLVTEYLEMRRKTD